MRKTLTLFILVDLLFAYPRLVLAAANADCAMKFEYKKIISYEGNCVDGYIHGKADVLYENNTDERLRTFGWFNNGYPSGKHIFLSKNIVLFVYYKPSGRLIFVAEEPNKRELWSPDLWWKLIGGEFDIEDDAFKDDKGIFLTQITTKTLFPGLDKYGSSNSIASVESSDIQNFLKTFSQKDRFAGTDSSLLERSVSPGIDPLNKNSNRNNANNLRRPVASPNLDALIKKIKGKKP